MRTFVFVLLVAFVAVSSGCRFGQLGLSRTSGELEFDPTGTVFAYVDHHDDQLAKVDSPRVAVVFTWLVFDPSRDLNALAGDELAEWRHEFHLRDSMALVFEDQADVKLGEAFERVMEGATKSGDANFDPRIHLAPEVLGATSTYEDFKPVATRRTVKVSIDDAGFDPGLSNLTGRLEVRFNPTDNDPADAIVGAFEGDFKAPIVEERVAEHNLSLLAAEDAVGLPLLPVASSNDDASE
jgi:hypothetical protein